jgi:hypothetical protein
MPKPFAELVWPSRISIADTMREEHRRRVLRAAISDCALAPPSFTPPALAAARLAFVHSLIKAPFLLGKRGVTAAGAL